MSSYDQQDSDVDEGDELTMEAPIGGGGGSAKARRMVKRKWHFDYHAQALMFGATITTLTFAAFVTSMTLIAVDQSTNHWNVYYFLNGDADVNGDVMRHVNFALWASIIGAVLGGLSMIALWYRACTVDKNGSWASNEHMFNAWIYFPIAVMDAMAQLTFMQSLGLSHVWVIVYGTVASVISDSLLPMMRLQVETSKTSGKQKFTGSSFLSVMVYLHGKFVPYALIAACVGAHWPGAKPAAAFIIYFVIMGLRVLFSAGCFLFKMLFGSMDDKGMFRWVVLRLSERNALPDAESATPYRRYFSKVYSLGTAWMQLICCIIAFIGYFLVQFQTQYGFGSGDRGGRHVYAPITWTTTTSNATNVEFSRTWPMGQYFVPFQFGLPMLMIIPLIMTIHALTKAARKNRPVTNSVLHDYWNNARDPYNAFAFGVTNGMLAWMLIAVTGTTEFTELFLALILTLVSAMMWAEVRKNYSASYAFMAMLAGALPYIHACVNVDREASRSNVELASVIVLFIAFGVKEIVTLFLLVSYETKSSEDPIMRRLVNQGVYTEEAVNRGIRDRYRFWHPDTVVRVRYALNGVHTLAGVILLYWLGAMEGEST